MRKAMYLLNIGVAIVAACMIAAEAVVVLPWIVRAEMLESPQVPVGLLILSVAVLVYAALNAAAIWDAEFGR